MSENKPKLCIVIPCYNEEEVLPITAPMFLDKINELIGLELISEKSKILFVNDGSKDKTWEIIGNLSNTDDKFIGISQSRNRGHQAAVLAGLMEAKDEFDITISIDCDGQDDINAMNEMVTKYLEGYEVVYGVRSKRDTDTFFYKLLKWMGAEVVFNHADYRLISSKVLNEFAKYKEVNIFLRGLIPLVGFKSTTVEYKREERIAGESHYPLKKMLALAFDGITSLSVKPIRMITSVGIIISILSLIIICWAIITHLFGNSIAGWASIIAMISFFGGLQMICIGIIGEYIGKIYLETKARPRYIISERTYDKKEEI